MKTRVLAILSTAIVLLLASLAIFVFSVRQEGAASGTTVASKHGQELTGEQLPPPSVSLEKAHDPTQSLEPSVTVGELLSIISNWADPLLAQPGWLHIKHRVSQAGIDAGTLPDGKPLPDEYIFESWYLLGDDGLVNAGSSAMYTLAGEEIQISIFEDRAWTNLTYDLSHPADYFRPNLDQEISKNIASLGQGGFDRITQRNTSFGGEPAVEISGFDDFDPPVEPGGFPLKVESIVTQAIFHSEGGSLLSYRTTFQTEDGQETVVNVVTPPVIERVDSPPKNILSLFKEVPQ